MYQGALWWVMWEILRHFYQAHAPLSDPGTGVAGARHSQQEAELFGKSVAWGE